MVYYTVRDSTVSIRRKKDRMYNPGNLEPPKIDLSELRGVSGRDPNWPYQRERPLGVTLIALWQFVGAVIGVVVGLIALSAANNQPYFGDVLGATGCVLLIT